MQSVSFADGQSLVLGADYTATVEYESADAGTDKNATVTVTLINGNYSLASGGKTATIQATGNILPRPVELKWSEPTVFTYDGKEKIVSAEITNLVGKDEVTLTYSGNSATDASTNNYTASVIGLGGADAHNYTLGSNTGLNWSIKSVDISGAVVTIADDSLTYNGNAIMPSVTVSLEGVDLIENTDYTVAYSDNINAGEATVTVTGMGNYSGEAGKSFTINPAPLTITGATVSPKTYDGKTDGTVQSVSFDGGQSLALDTDYTATVEYESADAGTDKNATVTVTMKNSNYSLEKNTIELDNQTITKATYADEKTASGYIVADSSLYSVRLPVIPAGASYGEPTYDGSDGAVIGLSIKDGVLHYTGSSGIVAASEYTVTVPVNGGTNYEDYNITVTLTGSDKITLTGGPSLSTDTITYGQRLMEIGFSGTMYAGATPVSGTFTWVAPDTMPKAGTYEAGWEFTPGDAVYSPASGSVKITVNPRPVELDWGTTVFTYDGTEKSVSATITNVVENDNVVPVYGGTLSGTEIKTYTATVINLGGTDAANYTIVGVANASQEWSIKSSVTLVSSVTMSRSSLRIYEGKSYSLSAAVSPADATNKSLYWSSSNPDIASVDQNGKVTGHKPGVCTVFAQAQDGSKVFAACTVRVLHWYPSATPITGDSSHLGLWIGVLAVSACAIGAAAFILIKKRKK